MGSDCGSTSGPPCQGLNRWRHADDVSVWEEAIERGVVGGLQYHQHDEADDLESKRGDERADAELGPTASEPGQEAGRADDDEEVIDEVPRRTGPERRLSRRPLNAVMTATRQGEADGVSDWHEQDACQDQVAAGRSAAREPEHRRRGEQQGAGHAAKSDPRVLSPRDLGLEGVLLEQRRHGWNALRPGDYGVTQFVGRGGANEAADEDG